MEYVFKVFNCEVNIAEQIYCKHVLKLHLEDKHLCFAVFCVNLKTFSGSVLAKDNKTIEDIRNELELNSIIDII
jgi:hypothetical protein